MGVINQEHVTAGSTTVRWKAMGGDGSDGVRKEFNYQT
jgi:hypothetical protein